MSRPPTSPVSTALALALAVGARGCPDTPPIDDAATRDAPPDARPRIFVSTNDSTNTTGQLVALTLDDLGASPPLAPLSGDAVLAWHDRTLVALNFSSSGQNNVTYLDVADPRAPSVAGQIPAAREGEAGAANPRGYLALDSRRAYLTRNSFASIAVVDRSAGAITGVIDLSAYRGGAALPNPRRIERVGAFAWISLERWSGVPLDVRAARGAIAVVDPASDVVVDADPTVAGTQVIELPRSNPVGRLTRRGAEVWVACAGAYQRVDDGAVVAIEASAPYRTREVLTEAEAGGNLDAAVPLGDDRVLARVVAREDGVGGVIASTRLSVYSLASRALLATLLEVPGYRLTEPIVARDGRIYVGQRGSEADALPEGVWVFAPSGERLVASPVRLGLRPYELIERPAD